MVCSGPLYGKHCTGEDLVNWADSFEADDRDPRTKGEGPCAGKHDPEAKYSSNTFGAWLTCSRCALRLHYAPKAGAPAAHVALGPTPATVSKVLEMVKDYPDVTANVIRGLIKAEQGRAQGAMKKNTCSQSSVQPCAAESICNDTPAPAAGPEQRTEAHQNSPPKSNKNARVSDDERSLLEEKGDTVVIDKWQILVRRVVKAVDDTFDYVYVSY